MGRIGTKLAWLGWFAFMALQPHAWSQVKVGDNTTLGFNGNAMFGYDQTFGSGDAVDSNNLDFGFNANLTGSYYHPNFLSFRVSPYYNQSRVNSDSNSIFSAKGVDAIVNLFSGGHTPVSIGYGASFNNESQFNVPGSLASYASRGNAQNLNIGAGLLLDNLPTLNLSLGMGRNNYSILGSNMDGSGNSRTFGLSSSYNALGFGLFGSYFNTHMSEKLPDLTNSGSNLDLATNQRTIQFGATRHLWDSANFSTNFTRNHLSTDNTGNPADVTYNTFATNVSMKPLPRLNMNAFVDYTTNLSALLLGRAIAGGTPGQQAEAAARATSSSNYVDFGTRATYSITKDLTASGGVDHRSSNFMNLHAVSNIVDGGLGYTHMFGGGQFGAHYGISRASSDTYQTSQLGHSAGISYAHSLWGWDTNEGVQFLRNTAASVLSYTQTGYGFNANASRALLAGWRLSLGANVSRNRIDQLTGSSSLASSYSLSVSGSKFSFGGNYGRSKGDSLQTLGGLVPIPGGVPVPIPTLLVLYSGNSYGVNAAFHPTRRFHIWSDYTHARYSTSNPASISDSRLERYNVRSEYFFRQLHFEAGYSHLVQGIGPLFGQPATVNAVYVGVSRHFDFF